MKTVREELEEYLGTKISDEQYQKCILAFRSSHQGPAALGGYAEMGCYAPFKSISEELGKSISYFFNGVNMSGLMSDIQKRSDRRKELINRLREEDEKLL